MDAKPSALIAARKNTIVDSWREALDDSGFDVTSCSSSSCIYRTIDQLSHLDVFVFRPPIADVTNVRFAHEIQRLQPGCRVIVLLSDDQRHQLADALAMDIDLPLLGQPTASEVATAALQLAHKDAGDHGFTEDGWTLDAVRWLLCPPGGQAMVRLTFKEREFLLALAEQPGQPVRRETFAPLFELSEDAFDTRRLEIMVRRLKTKISAKTGQNLPLNTAHGVGYALATPLKIAYPSVNAPKIGDALNSKRSV